MSQNLQYPLPGDDGFVLVQFVTAGPPIMGVIAPVTSTLKRVESGTISETVPRENLWLAQTPQVFRRTLLMEAYANRGDSPATDEASLVEQLGHPVTVVETSPTNIKITTAADFRMAEALVDSLPKAKGLRSLHPFADESPFSF